MKARIIDFTKACEDTAKKAYDWAVSEQIRMGLICEPIELTFESDNMDVDRNGCVLSIFHNPESNLAIYRRDWLNDSGVKYNYLLNLSEIKKIAPKSVAHMIENSTKIYHYYNGAHGGITRRLINEKDFAWVL